MADTKISALTAATTPLAGTEEVPIVQGGATVRATVDDVSGVRVARMRWALEDTQAGDPEKGFLYAFPVLVDAPGANKYIVPLWCSHKISVADEESEVGPSGVVGMVNVLRWVFEDEQWGTVSTNVVAFGEVDSYLWQTTAYMAVAGNTTDPLTDNAALCLLLYEVRGPVTDFDIDAGGTGYAVGDTGCILGNGVDYDSSATQYVVTSVDDGAITGLTITAQPTNPSVALQLFSAADLFAGGSQAGSGAGARIRVTGITTNKMIDVAVAYYVAEVADSGSGYPSAG